MRNAIVLSGLAGSGKDSAVRALRELMPDLKIETYAFADKLKAYASEIFDVPMEHFTDPSLKEIPIPDFHCDGDLTGRQLMQMFGDATREIKDSVWIERVADQVDGSTADLAVVTDARYLNELVHCDAMGWPQFKIIRPRYETTTTSREHSSETSWQVWNNWSGLIINPAGESPTLDDFSQLRDEISRRLVPFVKELIR